MRGSGAFPVTGAASAGSVSAGLGEAVGDAVDDVGEADGALDEPGLGAETEGFLVGLPVEDGAEEDDLDVIEAAAVGEVFEDIEAGLAGHHLVEDEDAGLVAAHGTEGVVAAEGIAGREAAALAEFGESLAGVLMVVDDEDHVAAKSPCTSTNGVKGMMPYSIRQPKAQSVIRCKTSFFVVRAEQRGCGLRAKGGLWGTPLCGEGSDKIGGGRG